MGFECISMADIDLSMDRAIDIGFDPKVKPNVFRFPM